MAEPTHRGGRLGGRLGGHLGALPPVLLAIVLGIVPAGKPSRVRRVEMARALAAILSVHKNRSAQSREIEQSWVVLHLRRCVVAVAV